MGQLLFPVLSIGLVVPDGSSSPKKITALSCKLYHYDIIVKVLFYTGELPQVSCKLYVPLQRSASPVAGCIGPGT